MRLQHIKLALNQVKPTRFRGSEGEKGIKAVDVEDIMHFGGRVSPGTYFLTFVLTSTGDFDLEQWEILF